MALCQIASSLLITGVKWLLLFSNIHTANWRGFPEFSMLMIECTEVFHIKTLIYTPILLWYVIRTYVLFIFITHAICGRESCRNYTILNVPIRKVSTVDLISSGKKNCIVSASICTVYHVTLVNIVEWILWNKNNGNHRTGRVDFEVVLWSGRTVLRY